MKLRHRLTVSAALVAATAPLVLLAPSQAVAAPAPTVTAPSPSTIAVGSNPADVAVSQQLGKAFVVDDGAVSVVSLLTRRVVASVGTGGYHGQNAIALSRDETRAYVTNERRDVLTVLDTETYGVSTIKIGYGGVDVAYARTPKGDRIYVLTMKSADPTDPAHNELVAIDPRTGTVVKRTKLAQQSEAMAVAPGGRTVWVGDAYDLPSRIWKISTTSGKRTATVRIPGAQPNTLTFSPDGRRLWVGSDSGVVVLDPRTGRTRKNISSPKLFPGYSDIDRIAFDRRGRTAYVVNAAGTEQDTRGMVAAVSTRSYRPEWLLRTGRQPAGIAVDTRRGRAYVPNFADDIVTTFRTPR